jgi:hypothetical protein
VARARSRWPPDGFADALRQLVGEWEHEPHTLQLRAICLRGAIVCELGKHYANRSRPRSDGTRSVWDTSLLMLRVMTMPAFQLPGGA